MKKKEKQRAPLEILHPGQRSEFWETILCIRDSGDVRWNEFSPSFRYSAEMYERNRDSIKKAA